MAKTRTIILAMRLTLLLLTVGCLQVSATSHAQTVTWKGSNVPLEKVFRVVRQQTGYVFLYTDSILAGARPVSLNAVHIPLTQFLDLLIGGSDLRYTIVSRSIVISRETRAPADEQTGSPQPSFPIRIKIVDENGKPLPGASVFNKKTKYTGVTDADGLLTLNASEGDILVISFVGMQTRTLPLNREEYLSIMLTPALSPLDEMQVIAYGTTTKRLNTADVSTVRSADIERQPVTNVMAALEGRVPGLLITQSSGVPGASFNVQIRGQNSLLQGSDPLFVIDGVPFAPNNTSMSSLYSSVGVDGLSPLNSINPADIERIEVLKDADATSIYGSRGANGVILITTKKGRWGKSALSANVYTGASVAPRTMDMMNTQQYLTMRKETLKNDGAAPDINNAPELLAFDTTRFTDFKKKFVGGSANITDAQLSFNGGSEMTTFLISGDFHNESTIFRKDMKDTRISFHSNISHRSADNRLTVNLSTSYVVGNSQLAPYNLADAAHTAPNYPALYDSIGKVRWEQNGVTLENPDLFVLRPYKGITNNLLGSLQLAYRILPGLSLKASMGYNTVRLDETQLLPVVAQNPAYYTTGSSKFSTTNIKSWIVEPQAEYIRNIAKGRLNVLIGATWQDITNNNTDISADGFTSDALLQSIGSATNLTGYSAYSQYRYNAIFGRIGYSWEEKYILNITGRRDGSSRFGPGRQFADFGGAGLAWIFTKENFARKLPAFCSFGKLRASYGSSGNDQIGNYQYLDAYATPFYPYNGQGGLIPSRLANANYGWEVNHKLEAALELGFLKERILLTASWFRNRSGNQLINYNLPTQTGFPGITENLPALIQNSGFEFTLNTKNIQSSDFTWTSTFNLTIHRNKLLKFPGLATSSYANTYVIGRSLNAIRGYQYLGVNDTTGVFQFTDVNKDGAMNNSDLFVLGTNDPKFYGGLQNSFGYKGWNLDVFVEFRRQYGKNYLASVYSPVFIPGSVNSNLPVSLENRWRKPGDHAPFQQVTQDPGSAAYKAAGYFIGSSGVYGDASFIRLKNIALSYSIPANYMKQLHLQAGRLYMHIQNLLTITGYKGTDPEVRDLFTLPPLRTFTAGIQITL